MNRDISPGKPVLQVEDLSIAFAALAGQFHAAKSVSLRVNAGEIVGLAGESGSGKTVTAMAIARLLPGAEICRVSGTIDIAGQRASDLSSGQFRHMRGRDIGVIFQDPNAALNPIIRVGKQINEVVRMRQNLRSGDAKRHIMDLLLQFGVRDPERVYESYPFELSGGLRQRIAIALAFGCEPKILIADEPTTALDVIIQSKILELIKRSVQQRQTGVLLISHDLRVLAQLCSRVYVMLDGRVVEQGPLKEILSGPRHPYTRALIKALPERSEAKRPLPVADWRSPAALNGAEGGAPE